MKKTRKPTKKDSAAVGIYKRPISKPPGYIYWFAEMVDGIRKAESLGTSNYREAIARRVATLKKWQKQGEVSRKNTLSYERDKYLAAKARDGKFREHTQRTAPSRINRLITSLGDISPASVDHKMAVAWYREIREKGDLNEVSAGTYLMVVKSFFSWMVQQEIIHENPFNGIRPVKAAKRARIVFATEAERDMIIERATWFDEQNALRREKAALENKTRFGRFGPTTMDFRFILYCGFHAGMRRQEIDQARLDWFDMDKLTVDIKPTDTWVPKDMERRVVPLTTAFAAFLQDYLPYRQAVLDGFREHRRSDYMLKPGHTKGRNIYRYDIKRPWADYFTHLGMSHFTPHAMRHSFATINLWVRKLDLSEVAMLLGDSVEVCRAHYVHFLDNAPLRAKMG